MIRRATVNAKEGPRHGGQRCGFVGFGCDPPCSRRQEASGTETRIIDSFADSWLSKIHGQLRKRERCRELPASRREPGHHRNGLIEYLGQSGTIRNVVELEVVQPINEAPNSFMPARVSRLQHGRTAAPAGQFGYTRCREIPDSPDSFAQQMQWNIGD
jgi:hypothetical protein